MKRPWVIKAGGELLADVAIRKKIVRDLAKRHRSQPVVFVHGGGPQIEADLVKNHVPIEFSSGRRVTSDETMVIVERVLSGQVNKSVVADLVKIGVAAVGLSGRDAGLLTAEPLAGLGRAGRPKTIQNK